MERNNNEKKQNKKNIKIILRTAIIQVKTIGTQTALAHISRFYSHRPYIYSWTGLFRHGQCSEEFNRILRFGRTMNYTHKCISYRSETSEKHEQKKIHRKSNSLHTLFMVFFFFVFGSLHTLFHRNGISNVFLSSPFIYLFIFFFDSLKQIM